MKKSKKFTLLELLIVIAIIGILMSMLLPALKTAKETAKQITCGSNIWHLKFTVDLYSDDYNDYLLPTFIQRTGTTAGYYWCRVLFYDLRYNPGVSWSQGKRVYYHCPAEPDNTSSSRGGLSWNFTDYAMNYYSRPMARESNSSSINFHWVKRGMTVNPSARGVLFDADTFNTSPSFAAQALGTNYSHLVPRHKNGVNVVFEDTHVEWVSYNDLLKTFKSGSVYDYSWPDSGEPPYPW